MLCSSGRPVAAEAIVRGFAVRMAIEVAQPNLRSAARSKGTSGASCALRCIAARRRRTQVHPPRDASAQCAMAIIVTSSRRRLVMIVLLALAVSGAVMRVLAPDPSTLRDIGTLLLVLWLPAVGNLVAYLIRRMPRRPPPATPFDPGAPFQPQLQARIEVTTVPPRLLAALNPAEHRCTVVVGRQGFIARLAQPLAQVLSAGGVQIHELQFLNPELASARLAPDVEIHLLVGNTAVAKGRVLQAIASSRQAPASP
jgi:hypothetical protein